MSESLPKSTAIAHGNGPGNTGDGSKPGTPPGKPPVHKRRVSNFLLDRKLQLRYVMFVTVLSVLITGVLGYLIYRQEQQATQGLAAQLASLGVSEVTGDLEAKDRKLLLLMVGVGVGLIAILFAYLVVMTHKVAGPLYKVSLYLDKMAAGRVGDIGHLRKGDMLQDFYEDFRSTHIAIRAQLNRDNDSLASAVDRVAVALAARPGDDAAVTAATAAIEAARAHVRSRAQQLA